VAPVVTGNPAASFSQPGGNPITTAGGLGPGEVVASCYRIKKLLGKGGMGHVWEAEDEGLCRPVALKTTAKADAGASLRQEGQALAALKSPVVPGVYALGRDGRVFYLAMELIKGQTLNQVLQRAVDQHQALPLETVLELLGSIASALDIIHSAGIAHHDLKPDNIMLAPRGRLVFLDFGVFVAACARGSAAVDVGGTPYYMAPEVIARTAEPGQGYLCDLYALGILAFELLLLRRPFQDRDLRTLFHQHLTAPVPPVRTVRRDVPAALEELIMELLAKSPQERPASAAQVVGRLQQIRRLPR
jgi:serine/threonine-protein kinase